MSSDNESAWDVPAVRALYIADPVARAALDCLSKRLRGSKETTVKKLLAAIGADGQQVAQNSLVVVMRRLEQAGCGRFVVGRRGKDSRFVWDVPLTEVTSRTTEEGAIPTIGQSSETTEDLEHRFLLRRDKSIVFDLPADLTETEAERLSNFILTLPFE